MICDVEKKNHFQLIDLWEKSVRATHDFLTDAEIRELSTLILNQYFNGLSLKCFKNAQSEIIGFSGVANQKIEMLFVLPSAQGQGVGSALCQHAIDQGAKTVDVNEQNPRAVIFYKKMGFKIIGRSELDGQSKPHPLLHMEI